MKVVLVDGDVSFPANSGKRLRTLNLMLPLARRHQITYIGRCAPGSLEAREAPAFLRDHGIEPILVHDPVPAKTGPGFYLRLARNLVSPLPFSVASHQSPEMAEVVNRVARTQPVDLWQFEWTPYLAMLDPSHPAPRLVMAHNVDTLIWQRYAENESSLFKRTFCWLQRKKMEQFEHQAFQQADRVVAVSADDADLVRTKFGQPDVDVVENGIDRGFFEAVQPNRHPQRILFLGALDWRPNLDGLELLLDRIFPEVRRQEPKAELAIVGRHPSQRLKERIAQVPGASLHADVADVRPFLGSASVLAVPLRIGGGSRLKILEALASGLPVVSTTVGAEGLNLVPGEHYTLAEPEAMATALVDVFHHPERLQKLVQKARPLVLDQFDWQVLAGKLEQSWLRCVEHFQEARSLGQRILLPV